jgi:hypothetical protein
VSDESPSEPSEFSEDRRHREPPRQLGSLTVISLVVALVALALAGWTLYRLEFSQASYSDTQRADAKVKVCAAMDIVRKGVSLNTNLQPAGGPDDVTGTLAVAANARVSLYDGGQYLLTRLDDATPTDLADAVRQFSNDLLDIGAAATAGAQNSEPEQAARLKDADSLNKRITELCQ